MDDKVAVSLPRWSVAPCFIVDDVVPTANSRNRWRDAS